MHNSTEVWHCRRHMVCGSHLTEMHHMWPHFGPNKSTRLLGVEATGRIFILSHDAQHADVEEVAAGVIMMAAATAN
jgi:hypothetical protein